MTGQPGHDPQDGRSDRHDEEHREHAKDQWENQLCPHLRGSTGYGYEFLVSNRYDWGGADFKDVLAAADYVIGLGVADPDRLGIGGWSYGGYMSAWAITQTTRFKAAVIGAPMTDMISMYGSSERWSVWRSTPTITSGSSIDQQRCNRTRRAPSGAPPRRSSSSTPRVTLFPPGGGGTKNRYEELSSNVEKCADHFLENGNVEFD